MTSQFRKISTLASVSLLVLCSSLNAYAAPGSLPTIPIYNSNEGVDPNIFITTDDSGSMVWEFIYKQNNLSYEDTEGLPIMGGYRRETIIPGWGNNLIDSRSSDPNTWIFYNPAVNKLYYNTAIDYDPWPGVDASGNDLYTDASITAVRKDPNSTSSTYNITNTVSGRYLPVFCTWDSDPNTNGLDESDPHTCVEIKSGGTFSSGRTYDEEIQNFANWMQYYRTRELAAKNALGVVVNATANARMGLRFINAGHQMSLAPMSDQTNKIKLLESIYTRNASGSTPLRNALLATGDMFTKPGAIVSAVEGGECQQNFNILMTDGFWNGGDPAGIDNEDGDDNTDFDGPKGNYADDYPKTLADVAMYFYENDLSTLADKVPTSSGYDLAAHQHLVNYTVAFGLTGSLLAGSDPFTLTWPKAVGWTNTTLDDLWHAAHNSRGLYLSADNPQNLLDSLLSAILNITERTTIASAAAVTSAKLTTDSIVYLAEYNSVNWRGSILAHKIKTDASGNILASGELEETPLWDASAKLDARDISSNPRNILTYDSQNAKGIPFKWDASNDPLTDAMKDDLRTNCSTTTTTSTPPPLGSCINLNGKIYCPATKDEYKACKPNRTKYKGKRYCYDPTANTSTTTTTNSSCSVDPDTTAMERVEFLRGDRSNEGSGLDFRQRATLLGDIVNSGPIYVGKPSLNYPDVAPFPTSTPYSKFKTDFENRDEVVYAGSNDGMFHAFDASNGEEILAYIPSYLFSTDDNKGLHYLTDKRYAHAFYNDLQATVADAFIGSWKTVLVGGARAGGRGYFALDVTSPGNFANNTATTPLWEFSSADDIELGFSYSRPQIGMLNDGTWVAIFGNGYNSTGTGKAHLFVVNLAGDVDGDGWTEGTDYIKISTGASSPGSTADPNGLGTPALADIDGNGTIDRAYAGDLNGNLWTFDLSGAFSTTGLSLAYSSPLFSTDGNEPITTRPILSFHPSQPTTASNKPNLMVFFGSGQYLVDGDPADTSANNFYGVWDKGDSALTSADLVKQVWSHSAGSPPTDNPVDYTTATPDYGWYIPLPASGERSVTSAAVRGSAVIFNSTIPSSSACTSEGLGYRYAVDLATGSAPQEAVLDLNNDGIVDENDIVTDESTFATTVKIDSLPTDNTFTEKVGYSGKDPFSIAELQQPSTGRFSWQELLK